MDVSVVTIFEFLHANRDRVFLNPWVLIFNMLERDYTFCFVLSETEFTSSVSKAPLYRVKHGLSKEIFFQDCVRSDKNIKAWPLDDLGRLCLSSIDLQLPSNDDDVLYWMNLLKLHDIELLVLHRLQLIF